MILCIAKRDITVKNKSILLKSVICGLIFLVCSLMVIFVVYIMDILELTIVLGILCGVFIAVLTCCDTTKRTVIARVAGISSVVVAQFILFLSGLPYIIIKYVLRENEWVKETGRLTVNEVIGYNFGNMFLWFWLLVAFTVTAIGIFIFNKIKRRNSQDETV